MKRFTSLSFFEGSMKRLTASCIHAQIVIALSIQKFVCKKTFLCVQISWRMLALLCAQCGDSLASIFKTTHLLRT